MSQKHLQVNYHGLNLLPASCSATPLVTSLPGLHSVFRNCSTWPQCRNPCLRSASCTSTVQVFDLKQPSRRFCSLPRADPDDCGVMSSYELGSGRAGGTPSLGTKWGSGSDRNPMCPERRALCDVLFPHPPLCPDPSRVLPTKRSTCIIAPGGFLGERSGPHRAAGRAFRTLSQDVTRPVVVAGLRAVGHTRVEMIKETPLSTLIPKLPHLTLKP